ncbi:methylmalonyl Co-A mutase-associated GTPase MeaB [Alicyclobacillus fastidiosus]|uniref:Methylmalonyl Co-A mutase-associated GTPase MeaB n=1 Tax=Alicyclobacillus fastidiosus TaxID=392011 RepID=A0ABV5AGN2_9BACL|nr:methylmalonyl Co-A mutase-associated GTPase MeaB [Alicyclobacillus fastidiosus]WEH09625.1 methylmalonyl Co-A mutase-associated GTPase MeaB [Alicyclobacillus fastidiosus]
MSHPLVERIVQGDRRALARALSYLTDGHPDKDALLEALYPHADRARVVGFTGAPGAGKSTLVNQLIAHLRKSGQVVGVLAVDPSSPFTGGSLLGDRVRMGDHSGDPGVFIRSVSNRGHRGGMAAATREMLMALSAFGCDVILLETVGVGQAELDVLHVADTVALVLTPGAGDAVQASKSGIMEIGDVFVLNKADEPGAKSLLRALQSLVHERALWRNDWPVPIVQSVATSGEGIAEVWEAICTHQAHMAMRPDAEQRAQIRRRTHILSLVEMELKERLLESATTNAHWRDLIEVHKELSPRSVAARLLQDIDLVLSRKTPGNSG